MRLLSALGRLFLPLVNVRGGREPLYVYVDDWSNTGQAVADELVRMAKAGVSHIILAFHLIDNPNFPDEVADSVLAWSKLDAKVRTDTLNQLHALGTRLLISSGGESEGAAWLTHDGAEFAAKACALARDLGADGFDFDKEGFGYMTQNISDWNDAAVKKCREVWPNALITAAPQSPHFSSAVKWKYSDGLLTGNGMDHYLIQSYNQGSWTLDTTYEGLFKTSGGMAIKELMAHYPGVGGDVFVVGKPFSKSHAGSGYVDHATLRKFLCQAYNDIGYRGGLMFWKHPWGQDISDYTMFAQPCDGSAFTQDPIDNATPKPDEASKSASVEKYTTISEATEPETESTTKSTEATPATKPTPKTEAPKPDDPSTDTPDDPVSTCQAHVTATDAAYEASCQLACELYAGSLSQFCPGGATEAADLIGCVLKQQSKCVLGCI